jgi:2-methylisocitrate lyase-like PEP mutase family enzyme
MSQSSKAAAFRALHARPGAFVIANAWDAGSAKVLTAVGFEAIATTSLGFAATLGKIDGTLTRDEVLANCAQIAEATPLPVSADLENCYAREPRAAATTIALAAEAGMVGGSIEDAAGSEIYDFNLAVERVQAAVDAARALPFPFVLTARAENFWHGKRDMGDTLRRLQAFERAGADVLFAPGIRTIDEIRTVCSAVGKPVNVVMSAADPSLTVAQLAEAGVKRISYGGALTRFALGATLQAAREMRDQGSFRWLTTALPGAELKRLLGG